MYTHTHIHVHTEDMVIPDPFENKYFFCFSMPTALRFGIYTGNQEHTQGVGVSLLSLLSRQAGRIHVSQGSLQEKEPDPSRGPPAEPLVSPEAREAPVLPVTW